MPKKSLKIKHLKLSRHKKSTRKHHKQCKTYRKNKKQTDRKKNTRGGYGPGAGSVGYAWKPDSSTWPGEYASNGGNTNGMTFSNYYDYNSQGTGVGGLDPATSTRGDLVNLNYQSGGGIFQDIGNLANYKIPDFFAKLNGAVNSPINPDVTKQYNNSNPEINIPNTLDLNEIITNSSNQVADI
jgi:hypothetical protein